MKNLLQNLADRIAGRDRDESEIRDEILKAVNAGEIEGDVEIIKSELASRNVDEEKRDELAREIVKASLGDQGGDATETDESYGDPDQDFDSDELRRGQELLEQFDTRLEAIQKSLTELDALPAALKTIGSALSLIMDDTRESRRDLDLLKSDVSQYLNGTAPGKKPVERSAPEPGRPTLKDDEIRIIKKGIHEGRFSALEVNAYVKSGMTEPSEAMRDYLVSAQR